MNTSTPSVSPDHQASQFGTSSVRARMPSDQSVPTPIVAAITQLMGPPMPSSQKICRTEVSFRGSPMRRSISARPVTACNVEPTAMRRAASSFAENHSGSANAPELSALSRNDPTNTPGQSRAPCMINMPIAMPEAGHMMVAYPGGTARSRPSLPVIM